MACQDQAQSAQGQVSGRTFPFSSRIMDEWRREDASTPLLANVTCSCEMLLLAAKVPDPALFGGLITSEVLDSSEPAGRLRIRVRLNN